MTLAHVVALALPLLSLLAAAPAGAQCSRDVECKGDRVCRKGECTDPAPIAAVAPRPEARARVGGPVLASGYGSLAFSGGTHTWGGYDSRKSALFPATLDFQFSPGLLLAGYWAPYARFHLGGFLSYAALGQGDLYGLGVTVKMGAVSVERVWLGVAFDVGAAFFDATGRGGAGGSYTNTAIRLFPRVHLDLLLGTVEGRRVAVFGAFGVDYSPVVGSNWDNGMRSMVTTVLLLGLSIGG